ARVGAHRDGRERARTTLAGRWVRALPRVRPEPRNHPTMAPRRTARRRDRGRPGTCKDHPTNHRQSRQIGRGWSRAHTVIRVFVTDGSDVTMAVPRAYRDPPSARSLPVVAVGRIDLLGRPPQEVRDLLDD